MNAVVTKQSLCRGHLVEPLCQIRCPENAWLESTYALQHVFDIGDLPPFICDHLVERPRLQ